MLEDGALEPLQLRAGLDPQRLDEPAPRRSVRIKRVGLATAPIKGDEELPQQPLAQWVLPHE